MKIVTTVLTMLCTIVASHADFYSYAVTPDEHKVSLAQSKIAFVGHAEILSMKFLGKAGRVLSPEEVASSKPFMTDPLYYAPESLVQRIELTVKLIPDEMLKGSIPNKEFLTFTYSNSLVTMCATHPRTLHKGGKMAFYVTEIEDSEVKAVLYGDDPSQNKEESNKSEMATPRKPSD